mmetsp:Transcript_13953/g.24887  ORF Transcript_13953/g.24887 Transcript_13953/m.24887 type:complete len:382 (-) Transcript_13953:54-1199(-)|eukprot:CAMPEP_0196143704 /NCGR_PEP_ID=MMETSP0910-20130528/13671_1 /TAXON_ID=49265 /ORGANISM="Thalassiosira rotula, Strain GSO102" /LENGTH=381 /DNA_ID=CAMNT_0041405191 /DNA_START=151 /DNA_END=1296 /DNA_ORIENTATION=+
MGETPLLPAIPSNKFKHKIKFLSDMIVGIDLLAVLLASITITLWINQMDHENAWLSFLSESKPAISTLGAFYSFSLVFRTNICYARWWEGRSLWGTMIVNSIRIAQQARLWIHDESLVDRLNCLGIMFSYTCKAQLRGNRIEDDDEDGAELVLKGVLAQEELDMMARQTAWQAYYCIDAMRAVVDEGLKGETERGNFPDWRKNAAHRAMENTIDVLASSHGGCIKVKSTGLPVAYDDILYSIGGIFFIAACAAWAPGTGLYNPILVLTIYIVVKMIIGLGNDMEDPFGHDESDLPLEKYCMTVEYQINAVDERSHMIPYNIAYGPGSKPERNLSFSTLRRLKTSSSYSTFFSVGTRSRSSKSEQDDFEHDQMMLEMDPLVV